MKNKTNVSFDDLASEYARKIRIGESPTIESYAQRSQELASRVRRLFPLLEMMEQQGDFRDDWSEQDLLRIEQSQEEMSQLKLPTMLGDFKLIKEIGRGGMGIVYEAEQQSLGRRVALKVLPATTQFDTRRQERFRVEARASAKLHHTNIVPVFGVGQQDGVSYFVMQYIDGLPLSQVIEEIAQLGNKSTRPLQEQTTRMRGIVAQSMFRPPRSLSDEENDKQEAQQNELFNPSGTKSTSGSTEKLLGSINDSGLHSADTNYWKNIARIGASVANALDYAHQQGVLHRDIKPSNLLVNAAGAVWVTDFGLAKYFDSPDLTQTGEVVGTLRYMSPEQLEGKALPSSDLFGLGLTMYEMLTLKPAYYNIDKKRLLENVSRAEIVPPRQYDSRIPKDLETIVCKCVESEPRQRYGSAAELADDLNRFLDGQPISARPIGQLEKGWKWCKRRPALAAMMAALLLSMALGLTSTVWQWRKTADALANAEFHLEQSRKATTKAELATKRSERHREQAQDAVYQSINLVLLEDRMNTPQMSDLRRKLLELGRDFHLEMIESYEADDQAKIDLGMTFSSIAEISEHIAKSEETLKYADIAIEKLMPYFLDPKLSDKRNAKIAKAIGKAYELKAMTTSRRDPAGKKHFEEGIKLVEKALTKLPKSNMLKAMVAELHQRLAWILESRGSLDKEVVSEINTHYQRVFELRKGLYETVQAMHSAIRLAESYQNLAIASSREHKYEQAETYFQAAVDLLNNHLESDPEHEEGLGKLGNVLNSYAYLYGFTEHSDMKKALEHYERSMSIFRMLYLRYPHILHYKIQYSMAATNVGGVYMEEGMYDQSLKVRTEAVDVRASLVEARPNEPKFLSDYGNSLMSLGNVYDAMNDVDSAVKYFDLALENHAKALSIAPKVQLYRYRYSSTSGNIGQMHLANGDYKQAFVNFNKMVSDMDKHSDIYYRAGRELLRLASVIRQDEDATDDEKSVADESIEFAKQHLTFILDRGLNLNRRLTNDRSFQEHRESETIVEILEWASHYSAKRSATADSRTDH